MIAQRIDTNNAVVTSDDATERTVQAAVTLLSKRPITPYRWICETCGMIHRGSAPASCESCGKEVSPVYQPDFQREMGSRW
jgi:rubrerythrin